MLRFPADWASLSDAERYALATLVDLARILPADDAIDAVRLRVVGDGTDTPTIAQLRAHAWLLERAPGEILVDRGLLRAIVNIAGSVAEYLAPERDRYDRVPSHANPLVGAREARCPVFAEAAVALRAAVAAAADRRPVRFVAPWPEGRRWAVALSHDLDVVDHWPVFTALRLAELTRKGKGTLALRVLGASLAQAASRPVLRGVLDVLEIERVAGVRSTWFILCGTPTLRTMRAGDLTYLPEGRLARRMLAAIAADGHEFGLHGSFATWSDATVFAEQRERLGRLVEREIRGVRQHYLRLDPGASHRAMHDAGFAYDSSCGFADRNGFRLGVADVIDTWSADRGGALPLVEAPFTWMDRALSKYQKVEDPARWVADALELADICRTAEGMWVGIWHPNLTTALGFPGAMNAYRSLVQSLTERNAFIAPIGDLVSWRATRRGARAIGVHPDGSVEVQRGAGAAPYALTLEDERGTAVQHSDSPA